MIWSDKNIFIWVKQKRTELAHSILFLKFHVKNLSTHLKASEMLKENS